MCGHEGLETIKYYLIGKENRMDNARKVYVELYKDFVDEVTTTGTFKRKQAKEEENEAVFIEELKKSLIQIEAKDINTYVIDELLKHNPELLMPVPCGGCIGIALFDEGFDCEKMKLPCFECPELMVTENHIGTFDHFVKRLYKAVALNEKRNLHRLAERNLSLISRIMKFYMGRFGFSPEEVEARFASIDPRNKLPRNRKH